MATGHGRRPGSRTESAGPPGRVTGNLKYPAARSQHHWAAAGLGPLSPTHWQTQWPLCAKLRSPCRTAWSPTPCAAAMRGAGARRPPLGSRRRRSRRPRRPGRVPACHCDSRPAGEPEAPGRGRPRPGPAAGVGDSAVYTPPAYRLNGLLLTAKNQRFGRPPKEATAHSG